MSVNGMMSSLRPSRLVQALMFAVCFVAGYSVAGWWPGEDDTTPLQEICARIDYVNGLQEKLKGQEAASEEIQAEFKKLIEQCRIVLTDRAEEND
jgi:hypothetical protein